MGSSQSDESSRWPRRALYLSGYESLGRGLGKVLGEEVLKSLCWSLDSAKVLVELLMLTV